MNADISTLARTGCRGLPSKLPTLLASVSWKGLRTSPLPRTQYPWPSRGLTNRFNCSTQGSVGACFADLLVESSIVVELRCAEHLAKEHAGPVPQLPEGLREARLSY